jgi:hypothetical protein
VQERGRGEIRLCETRRVLKYTEMNCEKGDFAFQFSASI